MTLNIPDSGQLRPRAYMYKKQVWPRPLPSPRHLVKTWGAGLTALPTEPYNKKLTKKTRNLKNGGMKEINRSTKINNSAAGSSLGSVTGGGPGGRSLPSQIYLN